MKEIRKVNRCSFVNFLLKFEAAYHLIKHGQPYLEWFHLPFLTNGKWPQSKAKSFLRKLSDFLAQDGVYEILAENCTWDLQ